MNDTHAGAPRERVIAVGLLTQRDLKLLGDGFRRAYPLTGSGDFEPLLQAIDEADQRVRSEEGPT